MNAAMMSGAGAGILAFPSSIKTLAQSEMNSAVVLNYEDHTKGYLTDKNISEISEKIKWADCIALGPGLGRTDETRSAIVNILERYGNKNFVIDADAIFALGDKVYKKLDLKNKILTPHHGEFANLLNIDIEHLKNHTLKIGREFTAETGAYLVLKGAPTIIFNPLGEIFINSSGNSGLAKFGSGDVLTGIIASFVAQKKEIEESVVAAVYLHGFSADLIMKRETEYSIVPQKLIDEIPGSIKFLRKSLV
jgi:NAD(P)H-hydrate epimerase